MNMLLIKRRGPVQKALLNQTLLVRSFSSQYQRNQSNGRWQTEHQNGLNSSYRLFVGLAFLGCSALYMKKNGFAPMALMQSHNAEALSQNDIKSITYDDSKYCTANKVLGEHLEASDSNLPNKKSVTLFHLYDSRNALHNQFLKQMQAKQIYQRIVKRPQQQRAKFNIVKIDVSKMDASDANFTKLLDLSKLSTEKVTRKHNPTFVAIADNCVIKLRPNHMNQDFEDQFFKQIYNTIELNSLQSVKDLAETLRENNRDLSDCTFVYCLKSMDDLKDPVVQQSVRLIRYETSNPIQSVCDEELAEKFKMTPGNFYCYYKPSYVNGFSQYQGQDIDFPYLQAFEGVCRDEFKPILTEVQNTPSVLNGAIVDKIFDQCFKRSYNVEFIFNTDIKTSFKNKYKNGINAEKPILVILWPEMFMSQFIGEFDATLRNYNSMFDVYYCKDEADAKRFFNTKIMPKELPHLYIIDPKSKKEIKSIITDVKGGLGDATSGPTDGNKQYYLKKYQGFIFNISNPGKELNDFIEKFLDDKLMHYSNTEEREQPSNVKWINAETFESEILKNSQSDQCVIEIIKDHCPACYISKFNFNLISRKMDKHGILDRLPFYRMKISNQIPWLGDFPHTPMHLYIRKEGEQIVEIKLLESPLPQAKTDNFLKQLASMSGISHFNETIKVDVMEQRARHLQMKDLEMNFDFDFDAKKDYKMREQKKN